MFRDKSKLNVVTSVFLVSLWILLHIILELEQGKWEERERNIEERATQKELRRAIPKYST